MPKPAHHKALRDKLPPLLVSGTTDTTPLNLNCADSELTFEMCTITFHKIKRTERSEGAVVIDYGVRWASATSNMRFIRFLAR